MTGDSVHLGKTLGVDRFHFFLIISFQLRYVGNWSIRNAISRRLQRVSECKPWENNWIDVLNRGSSFMQNLPNKRIGRLERFLQTFLVDHVKWNWLSVPISLTVSRRFEGWFTIVVAVLSSHERGKKSYFLSWGKLYKAFFLNGSEVLCWFGADLFGFENRIGEKLQLQNPHSWIKQSRAQKSIKGRRSRLGIGRSFSRFPVSHVNTFLRSVCFQCWNQITNQPI